MDTKLKEGENRIYKGRALSEIINIKDGKYDGVHIKYDTDGKTVVLQENYKNGVKDGPFYIRGPVKKFEDISFQSDFNPKPIKNGRDITHNIEEINGNYTYGQLDGECTYKVCHISSRTAYLEHVHATYKDGILNGHFYAEEGFAEDFNRPSSVATIIEGEFKYGKFTGIVSKDGRYGGLFEDGNPKSWLRGRVYKDGAVTYEHDADGGSWYQIRANGWCYDERSYEKYAQKNGVKDGAYRRYDHMYHDRIGALIEEGTYKDGKRNGLFTYYDKDGDKIQETSYINDKKHGFEKLYNSDGTVAETKYYQNGEDCTAKHNRIRAIASKRIEDEKAIEAETGNKTRLPKMTKNQKKIAIVKEYLGISK